MIDKWTENEIQLLKDNYSIKSKNELLSLFPNRTWSSILTKANKLNIKKRLLWSNKEDELLKKYYENTDIDIVVSYFPNRTKESIIHRAIKLNLISYNKNHWSEEAIQFIKNNWKLLPDEIIAQKLNKTKNAVKRQRNLHGWHRQDKNQRTYENITKYIRGNIYQWKLDSMQQCNYKCVLTDSKNFEIHHLYPVNKILNDIFINNNLEYKKFEEYSNLELEHILSLFINEQSKYPLGECIRPDLHTLFHSLYSQYNTTIEQWEQFKKDYKQGLYKEKVIVA